MTDADGHFSISGIAPGEYVLFAFDQIEADAWLEPDFLTRYGQKGERIKFEERARESRKLTPIPR